MVRRNSATGRVDWWIQHRCVHAADGAHMPRGVMLAQKFSNFSYTYLSFFIRHLHLPMDRP